MTNNNSLNNNSNNIDERDLSSPAVLEVCCTCRFYIGMANGGSCHRHAPVAATGNLHSQHSVATFYPNPMDVIGSWPSVAPKAGCGDWEYSKANFEKYKHLFNLIKE